MIASRRPPRWNSRRRKRIGSRSGSGRTTSASTSTATRSEAERAIDLIATHLPGREIQAVLDLACGAGRHSKPLCERWWTVGLDLSAALLRVARREAPDAPYVRADMRVLPFADESFDLVVNLFTSFGYFEDDHEHARVLARVRDAMKPGGTFVIDFLNRESGAP